MGLFQGRSVIHCGHPLCPEPFYGHFLNQSSACPLHFQKRRLRGSEHFSNVFKVTSARLEVVRAMIQIQIPLSPTFFAHTDPIAQILGPPGNRTGSKAGPRPGPQHSPEHSCLKQNLADLLGLINYRPISRVALSAIAAAAYLLIA